MGLVRARWRQPSASGAGNSFTIARPVDHLVAGEGIRPDAIVLEVALHVLKLVIGHRPRVDTVLLKVFGQLVGIAKGGELGERANERERIFVRLGYRPERAEVHLREILLPPSALEGCYLVTVAGNDDREVELDAIARLERGRRDYALRG